MRNSFGYLPYKGEESYAFLGCIARDEAVAASIADSLISRNIRLFNEDFDGEYAQSAETIANAIESSSGVIMFLSEKSIDSLLFRNAINYALSIRKPMICVNLDNCTLAYGMEMQLANVKIIKYSSIEQTVDEILSSGIVTQDMIGAGMTKRVIDRKKTYIMIGMILAALLIFAVSAFFVIKQRTSLSYVMQNVDGSDYLDISVYGEEAIPYLKDKTITEINMSNGGFKNVNGMENVSAEIIDVSDNPDVSTLWPLTRIKGLKKVKISQDMCVYAGDLVDAGIEVEILY